VTVPGGRLLACAVLATLVTACGHRSPATRRIVWSPDGSAAAVITAEGLYLSDSSGVLTPLVARDVYDLAWLDEPGHLILARSITVTSLATLDVALEPERSAEIAKLGEAIVQQARLPGGALPLEDRLVAVLEAVSGSWSGLPGVVLYLRETHPNLLADLLTDEENDEDDDDRSVTLHELRLARIGGGRLELGDAIYRDVARVLQIRPAPGGRAVAWVTGNERGFLDFGPGAQAIFVALTASRVPVLRIPPEARSPVWSRDGRSIVYLAASQSENGTLLGELSERQIFDNRGQLQPEGDHRVLAMLLMDQRNALLSLPDGRVLFEAVAGQLPATEVASDRLAFVFERGRTLTPLAVLMEGGQPAHPAGFAALTAASPDGTQVLLAGANAVGVLTVADGGIEWLPQGVTGFDNPQMTLPAWRAPGEFTYVKNEGGRNELILRRGRSEVILSRHWPDAFLQPGGASE
jgi:hypothetical protein